MPEKPIFVKTIVTMDLAKQIAADYGVETVDVLTGFKFIGEQIGLLEKKGEESRFILGFEESYGYLTGGYVRDKDAVDGALVRAEAALQLAQFFLIHSRSSFVGSQGFSRRQTCRMETRVLF